MPTSSFQYESQLFILSPRSHPVDSTIVKNRIKITMDWVGLAHIKIADQSEICTSILLHKVFRGGNLKVSS